MKGRENVGRRSLIFGFMWFRFPLMTRVINHMTYVMLICVSVLSSRFVASVFFLFEKLLTTAK
jgi:hypothetical protein